MSDLKLFCLEGDGVRELEGQSVAIEKSLQNLMEKNLQDFLNIRFVASEYSTSKSHKGRIDTLGLDENNCPVIIEYKRALNENVINQGLYYLDWLMDHKAEFKLLILEKYGKEVADSIEWSSPRLLCIAGDFTKYDEYAVQQINRNIELIRYKKYGNQFILLELVNATTVASSQTISVGEGSDSVQSTVVELLAKSHKDVQDRFDLLKEFLLALGDDVQMKTLKHYFAFKRFGNFACVEVHPFKKRILVYVKVNPDSCVLEDSFTRDVRTVGHYGTGDLEITISTNDDLERAKPLLLKSYEGS